MLKINGDLRKENEILCSLNIVYMSGLSLVLLKADCDWTRQTLNLSELNGERPAKPDLIHTSCRSESSNISLVVLDKDPLCPNATHGRLKSRIYFQREPSVLVKLLHLSPLVTLSEQRTTCPSPRTWQVSAFQCEKSRNRETSGRSVPSTAGHLAGKMLTNSSQTHRRSDVCLPLS